MLITKTPLRVSFFGGGTDFPVWYKKNGGGVLSASIDKYNYIIIRELSNIYEYNFLLRYYKREEVSNIKNIEHPLIRETLKYFNFSDRVEILCYSDLPGYSGLGSSSSFLVGLINAVSTWKNIKLSKKEISEIAIDIEQNYVNDVVGCQDQIAASYGGLNKITFNRDGSFDCEKITLDESMKSWLEDEFLLIYTNIIRNSSNISKHQQSQVNDNEALLKQMNDITNQGYEYLVAKDFEKFSDLLNKQWEIKKNLSSKISNPSIDELFELCINHGAKSGKLLGAGGGGFLLINIDASKKLKFINEINKSHRIVHFKISEDGTTSNEFIF